MSGYILYSALYMVMNDVSVDEELNESDGGREAHKAQNGIQI